MTVRRKYRKRASANSPRRRGIASRSRRLMVEVWRADSRVWLWLGGRALRVHAAETAARVDELEREPLIADLRREAVRRWLARVDPHDDVIRDPDDDPRHAGRGLVDGGRMSLVTGSDRDAETSLDDVLVSVDDADRGGHELAI